MDFRNAIVQRMSADDASRLNARTKGSWSASGPSWGERPNSFPWPANPFDVTHPLKESDPKNPWAAR